MRKITFSRGFTLIELLVVIAIIAVLLAFSVTNYLGVRNRAKDIKKKSEMSQVKNALRLYYGDFNNYPGPSTTQTNRIDGCGANTPPNENCMTRCGARFAYGPTGCDNLYMKQLPLTTDYEWSYRQIAGGDDFCLWTEFDTAGDPDIQKSQIKCASSCSSYVSTDAFVLCAD